jgi:magnesium-transporting ATPase (P-type)
LGYVETANLDGETNLKAKRACAVSSFLFSYGQFD